MTTDAPGNTPTNTPAPIPPETLKSALKAFRKRMKLTKLDDESKLGRSPFSSGSSEQIIAIVPPNQFPREVWEELVKQGQLKKSGSSFYQLVNP